MLGQLCQEAWNVRLVPLQWLLTWAAEQLMLLNDLTFLNRRLHPTSWCPLRWPQELVPQERAHTPVLLLSLLSKAMRRKVWFLIEISCKFTF